MRSFSVLLLVVGMMTSTPVIASSATQNEVLNEAGLSRLVIVAPSSEIIKQQSDFKTHVSYEVALQYALNLILTNADDIESPLSLYQNEYYNQDPALILKRLKCDLQNGSSELVLYTSLEPAERLETIRNNWIFRLDIPSFSDHIFWIIVDRQGKNSPYIYGFN